MENQGSLLPPPSIFLHLGLPLSLLFSLSTSLSFSPSPSVGQGCNIPKELLNGRVQERSLTTGRAVAFQCDKGYALQGDALVACVGDGTWSTIFPFCQPKPCPPPPGWKESSGSGNTSKRLFYVGQSLPFTCPKGHQAKGTATITCRSDQTWTSVSSACERVSCGPPLHVANGVVRGAVFQFGDVAVYSCFGGYAVEGHGRSVCLENRTWTPPPTCRAVCWLQCLNGGVCHRPNTCSCPEGWMGRLCEERKYYQLLNQSITFILDGWADLRSVCVCEREIFIVYFTFVYYLLHLLWQC
uniref:Sushi, von Willebrand factor type A, EGF and pentraxin domain containing 1 n=1 Tax=Hucho hucho TaxID=62062 RepID=A0A4W5M028_9TELE